MLDGARHLTRSFAEALRPPPSLSVPQWAEKYRIVSEESGSPNPGPWSTDLVPYMREPMECMGFDHPCRSVTVLAGAQCAKSEGGLNAIGQCIHLWPRPILVLLPSLAEVRKYNRLKLQPMIDATPILRERIVGIVSRDEHGSTTTNKRYRGGYLLLINAGSPKDLQMVSAALRIYEEVTNYPPDVGGRGRPDLQADSRSKAWHARGDKVVYISTPGIAGHCVITAKWEAGDRRRLYVPCPQCGTFQVLEWKNLIPSSDTPPYRPFFRCVSGSGCVIEHAAKEDIVGASVWLPTYQRDDDPPPPVAIDPDEMSRWRDRVLQEHGLEPSFRFWQAYSPFVTWESTMQEVRGAAGDPLQMRVAYQQALGEAWEEQGEAPEWEQLARRAGPYKRGTVPGWAVVLTCSIDVQRSPGRLEADVWAWGPRRQRGLVDTFTYEGDPSQDEVWEKADRLLAMRFPHELGGELRIEKLAVDAGDGAHTNDVYRWCRAHASGGVVVAIRGVRDYNRVSPVTGPSYVDVTLTNGRKLRRGARLWTVSSDTFKAGLYKLLFLRMPTREEIASGSLPPPGAVHFPLGLPDEWFKQLTAERRDTKKDKGNNRIRFKWVQTRERNEALDNAVYNEACAHMIGVDRWADALWMRAARERRIGAAAAPKAEGPEEGSRPPPVNQVTQDPAGRAGASGPGRTSAPVNPNTGRERGRWMR